MESRISNEEETICEGVRAVARIFAEAVAKAIVDLGQSPSYQSQPPQTASAVGPNEDGTRQPVTLTVEEAAKLLRISRPLAYRLVKNGQIPSVRLGYRHIISRVGLMRFIERGGLAASS